MNIVQSQPLQYYIKDDGTYPNSELPVLVYKDAMELPLLFPANAVKSLFKNHNWTNNWRNGIYTYHHYHSITHEAMGVCRGKTLLQLGGENGQIISIEKGDVIIIPAGVAHKNLGKENDVVCVGGYPDGRDFDMNYGKPGERPQTDKNIASLPLPEKDPLLGDLGLTKIWKIAALSQTKIQPK